MSWYREFSIESPYTSGVLTSMILGGWIRFASDYVVRMKFGENHRAMRWKIFYPLNSIYCSAEKVFVYRLLDNHLPIDEAAAMTSGARLLTGAGRAASMAGYGYAWLWRHLFLMHWVDTGRPPVPDAFKGEFMKSTTVTWLSSQAYYLPTDWIIQTYVPLEFRILYSMLIQAMPMQAWYTYRQLGMKEPQG